jgi:hypothetical protein
MELPRVLDQCLALLAGELRDSSGAVLTPASAPPRVAHPDAGHRPAAVADLAAGRRVVVPVELARSGGASRLAGWLSTRYRVARARRWLTAAGATRVRALAVVPGHEALFLVYELGGTLQSYVDQHVVLRTQGAGWWTEAAKTAVSRLIGADVSAALIVVVGERR